MENEEKGRRVQRDVNKDHLLMDSWASVIHYLAWRRALDW